MDKIDIKSFCISSLADKIGELKTVMEDVQNASNQETKSTAGDKHDTSRAQAQIEVERLGNQLKNLENMQRDLQRISTDSNQQTQLGSYVKTSCGDFYLAVALGRMQLGTCSFFAISIQSPVGMVLRGKKLGDTFQLPNGTTCKVEEVW